jgi:hypothetical protein
VTDCVSMCFSLKCAISFFLLLKQITQFSRCNECDNKKLVVVKSKNYWNLLFVFSSVSAAIENCNLIESSFGINLSKDVTRWEKLFSWLKNTFFQDRFAITTHQYIWICLFKMNLYKMLLQPSTGFAFGRNQMGKDKFWICFLLN